MIASVQKEACVKIRFLAFACLALTASAAAARAPDDRCWIATWAAAQQIPEPNNAMADGDVKGATLRQVVRTSIAGKALRVRFSNVFGTQPLVIGAAALGRSAGARTSGVAAGTSRPLTFDGRSNVTVPAGADYVSDLVSLDAPPKTHLTVSIFLPEAPARQTGHPGSRATSYLLAGNHVADAQLPRAKTVDHWYQLAAVETPARFGAFGIVLLGDSITDGHGVQPNTDRRWSDFLIDRLQHYGALRNAAVLNMGLGGNRVLLDGLGPNALARFDRDVIGRTGVRYVLLLEGVNDLGTLTRDAPATAEQHRALVESITGAYRQMVQKARESGIAAIGGTILPYGGSGYYHPDALNEADRQAINAWIRKPGNFDAVVDFDAAMKDPANPMKLRPDYDSGDGLHPSDTGYKAMADLVPLSLFKAGSSCR